jgi:hypothetical protein
MGKKLGYRVTSLIVCGASTLWATFGGPSSAPVERLIRNVQEYVRSHPQDASGYYALGRIHYLAFSLRSTSLAYYPDQGRPPQLYNGFQPGRASLWAARGGNGPQLLESQRLPHLRQGLDNLKRAIELDPRNGLYELGLACLYEDAASFATANRLLTDLQAARQDASGKAISGQWKGMAVAHYLSAYHLSSDADQKLKVQPLMGIGALVSYEAGNSYLRLVKERGATKVESANIPAIEASLAALRRLPMGPITPIVLSLRPKDSLRQLLAPEREVAFDLDGTGRPQLCEWLRPDSALLVWDPQHSGIVTSGRQLFGTVTWWMFWANGFQALDALDDNRDGWLRGKELSGLALWFDRNQNGRSDAGEVAPVEDAGIEALSTGFTGYEGDSPVNRQGVLLKDGSVLPVWDWVVEVKPAQRPPTDPLTQ